MTKEEGNRFTRHHRKPKSLGGSNEPENISHIKFKFHEAWHLIFGNMEAQQIAEEINKHYLDPEFKLVLKPTGYKHPERKRK